jgi:hypothetical protein
MDNEISNADLQRLLAENPLAAEQLRRIMAERRLAELQAENALKAANNGSGAETETDAIVEKPAVQYVRA